MLFAFFGLGAQEIPILLLIGGMFLVPALIVLAMVVFVPPSERTRSQTAIIGGCVRAMAAWGIWVVAGLVMWPIWRFFDNEWWALIAYYAVGASAGVLIWKLWHAKPAL